MQDYQLVSEKHLKSHSSELEFGLFLFGAVFFFFKSPSFELSQLDSLVPGTRCHPETHIFNSLPWDANNTLR